MFSQLGDKLQDIFKELRGHGTISESNIDAALRHVRLALLEADVDFEVAKKFIARVEEEALAQAGLGSVTAGQQTGQIIQREVTAYSPDPNESNVQRAAAAALEWHDRDGVNIDIFDTAGRQEIDEALIQELKALKDFLRPQETLLVVDAATGQQAVSIATRF